MATCTLPIFDEEVFEANQKQIESFKAELEALATKYGFGVHGIDDYNGMEEHCGTDYYFTVNGRVWCVDTIEEILNAHFWAVLNNNKN